MNQTNKQVTSETEAAVDAGADSRPVASTSRRRLIKLGASAVPVLATLTSPSALAAAGKCITTSAWGSQQASRNASEAARHASQAVDVTTGYKISAWNDTAQGNGTPWFAFKTAFSNSPNPITSITFAQLSAILATVYSPYYWNPSAFLYSSSALVMGSLTNDDRGYFLVAQLNYAVGEVPPIDCVSDDTWRKIVANNYPTPPWTLPEIGTYLQNNFIVQA